MSDFIPPCSGNPEPFDDALDRTAGPAYHAAVKECRAICGTCDPDYKAACLEANLDEPGVIAGETRAERRSATQQQQRSKKKPRRDQPRLCEDDGCTSKLFAKGCCRRHYRLARKYTTRPRATDVDPSVVERLLDGEKVPSTRAEREEAIRRWVASGRFKTHLCERMGWHGSRYRISQEGVA